MSERKQKQEITATVVDKKEEEFAKSVKGHYRSLKSGPLRESLLVKIFVQILTGVPTVFACLSLYYDFIQDASYIATWVYKGFSTYSILLSIFLLILPIIIWTSVEGHRPKTFYLLIVLNNFVAAQGLVTCMVLASIWYSETKQKHNPNVTFFYTELLGLSNLLVASFLSWIYLPILQKRSQKRLDLLMKRFD